MPGAGPQRPIPWRRIYLALADRYGWTAEQVSRLTLAQLWLYWRRPSDRGQTIWLDPGEAASYGRRKRQERQRWIDEQLKAGGEGL